MSQSFYRLHQGEYLSSPLTRGPWSADAQHGGPPCALLGTRMHQLVPTLRPMRLTFELFKPVPVALPLSVQAQILRQSRSVAWLAGSLFAKNQELIRAQGVFMRTTEPEPIASTTVAPLPGPEAATVESFFKVPWDEGYHTGMEVRFLYGSFLKPGPGAAWMRMRGPLLEDEETPPLARVLIAVDAASGVSSVLDLKSWTFVNADLSVHLHRLPQGEWVCLDARTTVEAEGVALAESVVHDRTGACGRSMQSLLVARRT